LGSRGNINSVNSASSVLGQQLVVCLDRRQQIAVGAIRPDGCFDRSALFHERGEADLIERLAGVGEVRFDLVEPV
jgi:hypothetical protein